MNWTTRLDARQRAMLAEMGVQVWAPEAKAVPATAPVTAAVVEPPAAPIRSEAAEVPAPRVAPPPAAPAREPQAPAPATAVVGAGAGAEEPAAEAPAVSAAGVLSDTRAGQIAAMDWDALQASVAACQACGLCKTRRNTVFGVGDRQADWMVIGEAPGEQEDRQGEPFVGAAGQLLDRMLQATGHRRDGAGGQGVYVANVLKCRPPANRNPQPQEVVRCEPYLMRQVALVKPKVIVAMGRFAVQSILRTDEPIGRLRGRVHHYQGVPVIVTYHPAYLLRNPADKAKAWADLCLAMDTAAKAG